MPVYPEVTINAKTYYTTKDAVGSVFCEPIGGKSDSGDKTTKKQIYVIFDNDDPVANGGKIIKRWEVNGYCDQCGITDYMYTDEQGNEVFSDEYEVLEGKNVGEVNSVSDKTYATRLDIPIGLGYEASSQKEADEKGQTNNCGFTTASLPLNEYGG